MIVNYNLFPFRSTAAFQFDNHGHDLLTSSATVAPTDRGDLSHIAFPYQEFQFVATAVSVLSVIYPNVATAVRTAGDVTKAPGELYLIKIQPFRYSYPIHG